MRPADRTAGLARAISARVYYGWFVAIAAGAAEFGNAASSITVLTFFVIPMTDEFGWSRTEISGATSVGAILGAALAPFAGRMVDRVGSRMVLVVGGVAVPGVGLFSWARSRQGAVPAMANRYYGEGW